MCLSTVYKNEVSDANMLAKNVADIKVENGQIIFTDLMGIRTVFDGSLEKVDLMDNYVIVKRNRKIITKPICQGPFHICFGS